MHIAPCPQCPAILTGDTKEKAELNLKKHIQAVHVQGYRPSSSWRTCDRCNGTGKFAGATCTKCGGTGQL